MAETLFIRLSAGDAATWAAFDPAGRLASSVGHGALAAARAALDARRSAVLVSAVDVISTQAELPAAGPSRLRQIVPFSLEDSLADDVEQMSFAIGARLPSGATPVAVAAKERVEQWLEQLRVAGITANAVYSEADGVPDIPGTLVLLLEGARIYGRWPGRAPFVFDSLTLRQVLDLVRGAAEEEHDVRHLLVYTDEDAHRRFDDELAALGNDFASVEVKIAADGIFPRLAATLAQRGGTNLLQGAYAPKSNWLELARPWRLAATLLITAVVLALLSEGAELWQMHRTDEALGELVSAGCQRNVGDTRPSACQREVQQRLGASAAGGSKVDFLSTLNAVALARGDQMRIDALSYRNGVMDLQLTTASVPALDEFARGVEQTRRLAAEIQAANQSDTGTEGRVRIVGVNP